jgi:hypothetical protein
LKRDTLERLPLLPVALCCVVLWVGGGWVVVEEEKKKKRERLLTRRLGEEMTTRDGEEKITRACYLLCYVVLRGWAPDATRASSFLFLLSLFFTRIGRVVLCCVKERNKKK